MVDRRPRGHAQPLEPAAVGGTITTWAAPDDGDEGIGTEILTYRATVHPAG
ncbi:hypothetical protein [Streptomyces sp. NPDC091215]|uniref:hypothetical protein n=1 Tax=Streptomyces sp. NPDC091215 TaxID=3155192 RepID=UPI00342924CF